MKKYQSYKKSGNDLLGEIPEHWEPIRLGMLGIFSSSGIDKKIVENEQPIRMVNYTDIIKSRTHNPIIDSKIDFMEVTTPLSKMIEHKLEKGDLVFLPSSETIEDLGVSSLIDFEENDIVYSYHIIRFQFKKQVEHYFKKYIGNNHSVLSQFSSEGKGTTRQIIGRNVFRNILVVLPPISEQKQIVQFLDDKTDIIDKLISTKEQKIKLLKIQRTSLINEVITKGINPKVKMKDSGVEWIGEIPEHYQYKSLKYLIRYNENVLNENTNPDYELNYLEISDVDNNGNIINTTKYLFKDCPSRCRRILSKGDVIISTVRTYLKSIGYIQEEVKDLICSTGFCVLTPTELIVSKFLFYQVLTEYFIGEVISKSVGVSYPSITSTELTNIKIILPPKKEQTQIVEHLDKLTKEIDDLILMEQSKIDLLKEYRKSLISEVITGKIDIRTNLN